MINYHASLVTALNELNIPVYYEMFMTSGASLPCVSYMELFNAATVEGDTLGYSEIQYQISIWDSSIATIQNHIDDLDKVMREQGFTRISSNEMADTKLGIIRKIFTYQARAVESFSD